ncbi:MAG: hypothetical protein ABI461_13870, partial [Polyangiaceae bacterium]
MSSESIPEPADSSPTAVGAPDDDWETEKIEPASVAEAEPAPRSLAASTPTEPPQARELEKRPATRGRLRSAISLGFSLSAVGFLAKAAIAIAVLTALAAVVVVFVLARGDAPPLASLLGLTASALAWG